MCITRAVINKMGEKIIAYVRYYEAGAREPGTADLPLTDGCDFPRPDYYDDCILTLNCLQNDPVEMLALLS